MKYDVVVIGSGMAALMAAGRAVSRNKSTLVITRGQGMLALSSGCIDLWGYNPSQPQVSVSNPYEAIKTMISQKPEHPYAKVLDVMEDSIQFFQEIVQDSGCVMAGTILQNQRVLTAMGTERISALIPPSMLIKDPLNIKAVIAVGFNNYPDFFPQMFLDNLQYTSLPTVQKIGLTIDLGSIETLRSNHLSLLLERDEVLAQVIAGIEAELKEKGLKEKVSDERILVVFPAVLGMDSHYEVWNKLKDSLGTQVIEVPGLPPSIPGQRLYKALTFYIRQHGAEFRHNSEVVSYTSQNGKIKSLLVKDSSNTTYSVEANSVILATGSFLGGGIEAKKDSFREPIFNIPLTKPGYLQEETNFLSPSGHVFLEAGLEVDDQLRPLETISNLYAAGSILAHFNYGAEKSGLGVALTTGYKAGNLV